MTERPIAPTAPETKVPADPGRVKRRQYLLLAAILGAIGAGTLVSVSLSGSRNTAETVTRPRPGSILSPGAQVDPRDAWRGQADAQLKAIEQRSRELGQRDSELEGQSRDLMERLKRLEAAGSPPVRRDDPVLLTPLPPPPVPAPALRPSFGPSLGQDTLPQTMPPPPRATPASPVRTPGAPVGGATGSIVSITLGEAPTPRAEASPRTPPLARDTRHYLPSGSFTRALLLGGLDAPTGGQAQRNPQPVLLRLVDHAVLPNQFRARVKECFVVGAGYGDVSAERAYIRTESLSCVTRDGMAIDLPIKGYVAGEDGKAGLRGRLVSKQGQILANALLAGVASGIGTAFQQSATTVSVSPLGTTGTVDPGKQLQAGLGTGVGKALDRLAQYYITLAEKVFPVIEVDAGRTVDVVLTQGAALTQALESSGADRDAYPLLARRQTLNRKTQDEDDDQ